MFNNIISTYTIEALIVHIICTLGSGTTLDDDDNKINNTVIIVTLYKKGKKKKQKQPEQLRTQLSLALWSDAERMIASGPTIQYTYHTTVRFCYTPNVELTRQMHQ